MASPSDAPEHQHTEHDGHPDNDPRTEHPQPWDEDRTGRILARLDQLEELFRRRLLDDRAKVEFVAELKERSELDDRVMQSRLLRPLANRLVAIVDRINSWDGEPDPLAASAGEEIMDVLEDFGVETIDTVGQIDPSVHRVVKQVPHAAPRGTILDVHRYGITLDGRVIRAADVVVSGGAPVTEDGG